MIDNPPRLNPALREFWTTPARNRILYGGRASSKSWDAAGFAIFLAQAAEVRFLCVRQFQNNIAESVYTLLKTQIKRFGLEHKFKITENKISCPSTGSEFAFYGLWRNIDEIKSYEGVDVLWIEEAHGLTEEQWLILEPTIRKEGSQVWIVFNPRFSHDFVYENFVLNPPPNTVQRLINYDENPFLSNTMLDIIKAAEDKPWFNHVYKGMVRDGDQFFSLPSMLVNGAGVSEIISVDYVFAVIDTAIKDGKEHDGTGVVFFGHTKNRGYPLLILDWDYVQIKGSVLEEWLPSIYENLEYLARQHIAIMGSAGAFIEDKGSGTILLQQAEKHGWQAQPIPANLTAAGKDGRAISISGYVFQEMVKFTDHAHKKTIEFKGVKKNHLLSQVVSFRPADKDAHKRADDLLDCFTGGIAIALGDSEGY